MKLLLINNPWGKNVYNDGIGKYCIEHINEDTIRIVHKGFIKSSYYTEMYLICENKSDKKITIKDNDDSLSINNSPSEYTCYDTTVEPNSMALLIYRLDNDSLEKHDILSDSDIEKIDFSIAIRDDENYKDVKTLNVFYEKDN